MGIPYPVPSPGPSKTFTVPVPANDNVPGGMRYPRPANDNRPGRGRPLSHGRSTRIPGGLENYLRWRRLLSPLENGIGSYVIDQVLSDVDGGLDPNPSGWNPNVNPKCRNNPGSFYANATTTCAQIYTTVTENNTPVWQGNGWRLREYSRAVDAFGVPVSLFHRTLYKYAPTSTPVPSAPAHLIERHYGPMPLIVPRAWPVRYARFSPGQRIDWLPEHKPDAPPRIPLPPNPRPPGRGRKERKYYGDIRRILFAIYEASTEVGDFIECLYDALPEALRKQLNIPSGVKGQPAKAAAIYKHFNQINLGEALRNLLANQAEDAIVGRFHGALSRARRDLGIVTGLVGHVGGPWSFT